MGALSALGCGIAATSSGLFAAQPPLPLPPRRVETALKLPVFEISSFAGESGRAGGVTISLLESALAEALDAAQLTGDMLAGRRVGVAIGTTVACQLNDIPFYARLREGNRPDEQVFRNYVDFSPAEYLRRKFRLKGPALTVSNACTSGADAIGIGGMWIASGQCDIVIAGGADELNRVPLDGFNALGVCSQFPCAPFDAGRAGLNLGEGAGVVVLETLESAARRGVKPRFTLRGFGKRADAFHITQPHPEGRELENAIRLALRGLPPEEIGFVNAHGTGTLVNDRVEGAVLNRVFGPELKFMSTKAVTGHTLGAAGALEFIFCCLMLEAGMAARSHRFQRLPEDIPLAPLRENCAVASRWALSTSLAFGGSNTALLVAREGGEE